MKFIQHGLIWIAFFIMLATSYKDSESFCVVFPQFGRDIFGIAQRNIIIFSEDEVSLIPQVHFEGNASDFAVLIPVPAEPRLSSTDSRVFTEASFMTQPVVRQSEQGCSCKDNDVRVFGPVAFDMRAAGDGALVEEQGGGVTIVFEQLVGMFEATVLQTTDSGELTDWLNENGYRYDPGDPALLDDYVRRNWYFVAMKLDPSQVPDVINRWWAASTSPAKISFAGSDSSLTYPLKISSASTDERAEVLIYTIAKQPMRFPEAEVEYANEVTENESGAISEQYPAISRFINKDMFVTKLRRSFSKAEMQEDFMITVSQDRTEYRDIRYSANGSFNMFGLAVFVFAILLRRKQKVS